MRPLGWLRRILLLGSILALLFTAPPPGFAVIRTVTDFGDSGAAGQLRTLINQADIGDTIVIGAGTITLTGAAGEDANASGDLDIVTSLTIQGAGQGVTIIDGGGIDRVIDIRPGTKTVNLSNLTIRNGVASGGGGGIRVGILNTAALTNVTVSDNTATSLDGGGISNSSGLTLTNVTLSGNKTTAFLGDGGAINNSGTMTVTTSTLSGNTAEDGDGGAINNSGTLTVTNSTLSGNTADRDGGAIENTDTLTLNNVTLSGNTASGGGGAIENRGTLTVTNSSLRFNTAGSDGGCIRNFLGGDVILTNSSLELNSAAGVLGGGCIHNFGAGSTVTLHNSALFSNQANGDGAGGGINNGTDGTVTLTNVTLHGNRATGLGGGGGISNSNGGTVTLTNVTIFANVATAFPSNGGGINNSGSTSTVTLTNTLVSFNHSDPFGNTPSNCATTLDATITSLGHNFDTGTTCDFAGPGDISDQDPKQEGVVQDNGGPTPIFALLPGSLAVDAGDNASCPPTDQRGFRRPVDRDSNGTATCDIGAFELVQVQTAVAASVLPTERTAQAPASPATTVTAFGNILNGGAVPATGCAIAPFTPVPATFTYQTTGAQNQLTGSANTPANIPAFGVQSFVFAFTPTAAFPVTEVQLSFACTNSTPAPINSGVNTFRLRATATPPSDIVAIALTPSGDGIVRLASTGVFVVATVNLGAPGLITVSADTGAASLPVTLTVCETDPVTSVCLADPTPSVQTQIATNATPTFAVFVTNTAPIPFDPANSRVQVHFEGGGGGGGTSVAVCSVPLCLP